LAFFVIVGITTIAISNVSNFKELGDDKKIEVKKPKSRN
jgi:hypothetical protein